jgi:hypothetical protein
MMDPEFKPRLFPKFLPFLSDHSWVGGVFNESNQERSRYQAAD